MAAPPRKKAFASRGGEILKYYLTNMFYVYVLQSLSDAGFYIGYSADLKKRIRDHMQRAAVATKNRGRWKLIYYAAYIDSAGAKGRERHLKVAADADFFDSN